MSNKLLCSNSDISFYQKIVEFIKNKINIIRTQAIYDRNTMQNQNWAQKRVQKGFTWNLDSNERDTIKLNQCEN